MQHQNQITISSIIKTFIKGLLAQVYLYKAGSGAKEDNDYAKASQYAKEVLASGITLMILKQPLQHQTNLAF